MKTEDDVTIYTKDPSYTHDDAFTVYLTGDGRKQCVGTACALPALKHLTGPELAAEYWMQLWGLIPFKKNGRANTRGKQARHDTMHRFATLPHAAESNYE